MRRFRFARRLVVLLVVGLATSAAVVGTPTAAYAYSGGIGPAANVEIAQAMAGIMAKSNESAAEICLAATNAGPVHIYSAQRSPTRRSYAMPN